MTQTTDQHSGTAAHATAAPASGLPGDPELPEDPEKRRARSGGIVPVLAFAGITVAVMQTLLVPVIKDLPTLLSTSPSNATWVMTSTLLAGAVATPIMGRLGDLYGKRRMLLASLAVMVIGSLICGFTDQIMIMIVGRALQGFAMGAIPLGIGLMRDELPRERLAGAMALMSSSIGVGGGLGLPGAAFVAQHFDWHVLFFTAAGLGVLAILLTLLVVPESSVRAQGSFDLPGALGLTIGLILLLLPVTKGSDWGWSSTTTLGLFGAAVVVLLLWGLMELKFKAPLVDLRTTARREVLLTNLASIMVGVAFYAISLVLPQLLQVPKATGYGLGQSMVVAGLCVAPLGLTMMLTAPIYAKLSRLYGPKVSLLLGMVIIGIGYGAGQSLMNAAWQTVVISVVVGAGIGLAYSSLPALIIGAVDPSETGAANGLNTLMRSIGTSVSSAVIGMVLARTAHVAPNGIALPTMHGFRLSFLIATAAVAGGVLFALFLPSRRRKAASQQPQAKPAEDTAPAAPQPAGPAGPAPVAAGPVTAVSAGLEPAAAAVGTAVLTDAPAAVHGSAPLGRVLDATGSPVARAKVTLIDGRGRQAGAAFTDTQGRFALTAPRAGSYVLAARAAGHAPRASAATSSGPGRPVDVTLTLPALVPAQRTPPDLHSEAAPALELPRTGA